MTKTLGPASEERDRRSIQSIQIGFRIVSAVRSAGEPMTLSAIARAVEMAPSKAVLYLNSFCTVGLLAKDHALRYRLGPYALELGLAALNDVDAIAVAREEMPRLRNGGILAAYLSVWGSQGPVIVSKEDKHPELAMTIRIGHVLPLLSSATGHVYLAFLAPEVTRPLLERERAPAAAANAAVAKAVKEVQKTGVASLRGHVNTGVIASAAPILDRDGALAAVLTVLSPKPDGRTRDGPAEKLLLACVRHISARLGAPVDAPGAPRGPR
jgi:DNA-binding IclR family transcriptional regulator